MAEQLSTPGPASCDQEGGALRDRLGGPGRYFTPAWSAFTFSPQISFPQASDLTSLVWSASTWRGKHGGNTGEEALKADNLGLEGQIVIFSKSLFSEAGSSC